MAEPHTLEYFAKMANRYDSDTYWRSDEDALVNKYFTNRSAPLLVLGCGAGRTLQPLHDKGFARVTAIDISPEMVAYAKKKGERLGIEVSQMDATELTFSDSSFEYVFFPFHGIDGIYPDIYAAVREAARVLKPGGVFIFNSHNRFALKRLHRVFVGRYDVLDTIKTYRATPFDWFKLRRYFKSVRVVQRISLHPWAEANWRDRMYKLLPILNKSTYFVCTDPRRS